MKNKFIIVEKNQNLSKSSTEGALFNTKSQGLGAVGESRILPEVCRGANSSCATSVLGFSLSSHSSLQNRIGMFPDPTFHTTQSKEAQIDLPNQGNLSLNNEKPSVWAKKNLRWYRGKVNRALLCPWLHQAKIQNFLYQ